MQDLESPKELSIRIGWPERRIRNLIASGDLRHLRIGARIFIPRGSTEEFVNGSMVQSRVSRKVISKQT